jgi:serine-type D-Ala-D-Ala carboxypeptidase/endopeptidase (penicillin-binding protein 4)
LEKLLKVKIWFSGKGQVLKFILIFTGMIFAAASAGVSGTDTLIKHDTSIQNALDKIIKSKNYPATSLRIAIRGIERDTTLVAYNADSMSNPASVTKLVTAAVSFEKLGLGYLFATRIFVDTVIERDSTISVHDLYIQGGGDPGFTAERLWLLVEHLYHCGIRKITGDLVLDDFFFDSIVVGPGFDEDSTSNAYQPLINALSMNFNTVAVHCRPGSKIKQPVVATLFPEIAGIKVNTLATTVSSERKNDLEINTTFDSGTTRVVVQGALGRNAPGSYNYRKLWQTWEAFGNALVPLLAKRGIAFTGKLKHAKVPRRIADQGTFYEFSSEPLSEAVTRMFKYSSNFTAEMLFKTLSARRDTTPGSWDSSIAIVGAWWKKHALTGAPIIKNGSGMGNTNRFSPLQIVGLLSYVWQQKTWLPDYLAALSTSGFDGTLKSRFLKSPLKGLVRAKTGTLNAYGISTLAGYLLLPGKPPYAFAIFCDKTGRTQFDDWMIQEQLLEKTAEMIK